MRAPFSNPEPSMLHRRHVLSLLALSAALLATSQVAATEKQNFSQQAFDAAQAAGKPILIDVSAPWCPVCKTQGPILSKLGRTDRFKNFVFFNVDFDTSKDLLKRLNVQRQSTLIVYKGGKEVGRSVGDTNPASIEALLAKAI